MHPNLPVVIYSVKKNFLVGSFSVLVEDRVPQVNNSVGKYKHQIKFKFLFWSFSTVIHSMNPGVRIVNDKEVLKD